MTPMYNKNTEVQCFMLQIPDTRDSAVLYSSRIENEMHYNNPNYDCMEVVIITIDISKYLSPQYACKVDCIEKNNT